MSTGFKGSFYLDLIGSVSIAVLEIIEKEEEKLKTGCLETGQCVHKYRYTMGLPCAHKLEPYAKYGNS